jgi:putative DNA methylase
MNGHRKKMIEVALPLEAINKAAAKEKSIRHGHPSTLHLWWARRPLAACRAVLFASLVDDPDSDPMFAGDEDLAGLKRAELFNLIEELVQWENSNNPRVINKARAEIARCVATQKIEDGVFKKDDVLNVPSPACARGAGGEGCAKEGDGKGKAKGLKVSVFEIRQLLAKPEQVNAFLVEYAPPVLDPFCGGGSIPLEAQRLGLRAYASDLNPVPVLITKALIEIPPKFMGMPPGNPEWQGKSKEERAAIVWQGARGLAEDVRYYGRWVCDEAKRRIAHLYPKMKITAEMTENRSDLKEYVGKELTVIAWVWARTVVCPNPACSANTPIAKTFALSAKKGNEAYAEPIIESQKRRVRFRVVRGKDAPREGNVNRRGADCLLCGTPIALDHIRDEATAGRMGQQMMAIILEGRRNRVYVSPTRSQIDAANSAAQVEAWMPSTSLPSQALGFRVQRYGMTSHAALFSRRQIAALSTFADLIREVARDHASRIAVDGEYSAAIATYLAFALSKAANYWSTLCSWYVKLEKMVSTFGLPTLSMVWDFAEANPFSDSSGNWMLGVEQAASGLDNLFPNVLVGQVSQLDATQHPMNCIRSPLLSTDPPYYDNIGYANLSDFFYVWLRRCLSDLYPTLFSTVLTPKEAELIAEPGRFDNDRECAMDHFEQGSTIAFTQFRAGANTDLPMTVFYAFKQQESEDAGDNDKQSLVSSGWEKMLASLISAGCSIQGTWPIRTEQTGGLREAKRNALASSIVLVCRSRPAEAALATRKEFMGALRQELPNSLRNLQHGNIAPVDLAQAAIGPGMAMFTRYSKVIETDGALMPVRTALGIINQVLDEVLAEQEGEFDGDTRWALAWFEQFAMEEGPFGVAETLSKAKNTSVNGLVEAGFLQARSGKVRLLRRDELDADWDPATDQRLTIWEVTQHLIRTLETSGESAAAVLVHKLGGIAEIARDLAYRLYNICERKKWADEALAYNGLVIAWPELTKLALAERSKAPAKQTEMF